MLLNETAYLKDKTLNQHYNWLSAALLTIKMFDEFECMKDKTMTKGI